MPRLSLLLALLVSASALAHISLEQGGTHKSRSGELELKGGPCGLAGSTRGTRVYTYAPGQTITVSLKEYVSHPSYFRFAFDNDGDDDFKSPASILPIDPARACPDGPGDHCGASDFYNSKTVLPGMDNLNPHLATPGADTKFTWQVTLPDVECSNCTLQVIQVMEDDGPHGPYDPTPGVGIADIYYQCIDLTLKRPVADAGSNPTMPTRGCTVAGSGSLLGVALWVLFRKRSSGQKNPGARGSPEVKHDPLARPVVGHRSERSGGDVERHSL